MKFPLFLKSQLKACAMQGEGINFGYF